MSNTLKLFCSTAVMAALAGLPLGQAGAEGLRKALPPQSLAQALETFAKETGVQVLYTPQVAAGVTSRSAPAGKPAKETLRELLRDTGLTFEFVNERTVTILPVSSTAPAIKTSNEAILQGFDAAAIRLVEVDAAYADAETDKKKNTKGGKNSTDVEEMVVEGSRDKPVPFSTSNLDLTRTKDDALPFTTFTARDIELSGATSLQEFLTNKLPQNFSEIVLGEVSTVNTGQITQISMRGWNANETVILLNGRRMAPQYVGSNGDGSNTTPNLGGIPLRSIERIEILSSAGSAIYGANATGGVINIITRTDYQGGQLNMNYASPSDVHAPARGAEASYAMPLGWGSNLRLTASYNESQPLTVGDRADVTIERWRTLTLQREPARLLSRTASPPLGATANIRTSATDASANLFGPGTANFTTVPAGYTGGGGLAAFQQGVYNVQLADNGGPLDSTAKNGYLGTAASNMVFALGFDKNFGADWRWSVDYRYSQNDFDRDGASMTISILPVPAAAPSNPFARDVWVRGYDPNVVRPESEQYMQNRTWDVTSTLRGRLGRWHGYFDLGYSENTNNSRNTSFSEPRGGWTNAIMSGAYNPFVDTRVASPAAPAFYNDYVAFRYDFEGAAKQYLSTLKASGPVLDLPAGPLQLTAGVEWSRMRHGQSLYFFRYIEMLTGNQVGDYQYARRSGNRFSFDTHSAYTEVNVPLLAGMPLVNKLELTGSGRLDRRLTYGVRDEAVNNHVNTMDDQYKGTPFQDATQANVYALALRYDMLEGVAFRASQSVGFRPPALFYVSPPLPNTPGTTQTVSDRLRPNGTAPSTVVLNSNQFISGGNAALRPETTDSTNFGFIFSPARIPGLRLSVDYLESVRDDVITGLSAQQTVDLESEFPGRVTRGAPDGHPSGVGPITYLDLTYLNFRQIIAKSVDFTADHQFQNVFGGRLGLTLAATKNISFKVQSSNTAPPVEQVRSLSSTFSQQIAWNGNGQLYWEGKNWGFGWSARYYDYIMVALSNQLLQGADRIPWKINHDAFVSYRMERKDNPHGMQKWLSGTAVTFGMRNVFDRQPRFWAANTDRGVAPYDSIMGRSVWLQMRKDFD